MYFQASERDASCVICRVLFDGSHVIPARSCGDRFSCATSARFQLVLIARRGATSTSCTVRRHGLVLGSFFLFAFLE